MPKDTIDLKTLLKRIKEGKIQNDMPLLEYCDKENRIFYIFQNTGLNILLGNEGNGKTKFITEFIIQTLKRQKCNKDGSQIKILLIDTERAESQYAFTIQDIFEKCGISIDEVTRHFYLLAVCEFDPQQIIDAIDYHLKKYTDNNYIIIIDHILPLVTDMNNVMEANQIDRLLKHLIFEGHTIIATIHKPSNGIVKGLGHLGSALQRLASFILKINNYEAKPAYMIRTIKSRISAKTSSELILTKDKNGNIDANIFPEISEVEPGARKEDKTPIAKDIFLEFHKLGMTEKKQLLDLANLRFGWSSKSSSVYAFYDEYLKQYIIFNKDGYTITPEGEKIIKHE